MKLILKLSQNDFEKRALLSDLIEHYEMYELCGATVDVESDPDVTWLDDSDYKSTGHETTKLFYAVQDILREAQ